MSGTGARGRLQALAPLADPPRRTRLQLLVAAAVVLVAGALMAGWDGWLVAVLGLCLLGAGLVGVAVPRAEEHRWRLEHPPSEPGARTDLLGLAVAFTPRRELLGRSGLGQAGLVRVQALGRSRLRRRGLDLDSPADRPAVEALLGAAAVQVLLSRSSPTPGARAVARCLDRVEALGSAAPPPPPPPSSSSKFSGGAA